MRARTGLLVVAVVALAVVALLLLTRARSSKPATVVHGSRTRSGSPPASTPAADILHLGSVPVEAGRLKVEVRDLRVQSREHGTEWSFLLVCHEEGGCRGDSQVTIHYLSRGQARTLRTDRQLSLANGGEVRVGLSGGTNHPVDTVQRITVKLLKGTLDSTGRPEPIG